MNQNLFRNFILTVIMSLLFCTSAFPLEGTKPEGQYNNVLVTENNKVYGVTDQKTGDGKFIPIELTGEEKIKVVLNKFAMKDDVTIDMLKPDGANTFVVAILQTEKKISADLLSKYLKDKNPLNKEKANFLLGALGGTNP